MKKINSTNIITGLLLTLCILAALDLWRQYAINNDDYWFYHYSQAVKSQDEYSVKHDFWKFGYEIEDLEMKLFDQRDKLHAISSAIDRIHLHHFHSSSVDNKALRHNSEKVLENDYEKIRMSRTILHQVLTNDSSVFHIHCQTSQGPMMRIGSSDLRADPRDSCQLFGANSDATVAPHTMFERIFLDDGQFALRSLSSNLYVSAVPPPRDHTSLPWKLVVGGPSTGAAERFRQTEDGYLYSSLMKGFFQCSADDMMKGYPGTYSNKDKFLFESVSDGDVFDAQKLVFLSREILNIQNKYKQENERSKQVIKAAINIANSDKDMKICLGIPMTSKGTVMDDISDSPFWSNLFDSFMKSIDWKSNKYIFGFYLGFDTADMMYDVGDAWSEMRKEFKDRATFRMKEQLLDDSLIEEILISHLTLKLMHFDHLQGAPSQVVSQLMLAAYVENYDYFYQVNDDTSIITPNWAPKLISTLASNPMIPNFGVTGPMDSNNNKIFTHSFVHRTHLEIFGHLFPTYFKNWWSDDWISTVYGSDHTFLLPDVEIKHNVASQKEHGYTRYDVDKSAQLQLENELIKGHMQIDVWLKKNSHPRLPLPNICGYIPMTKYISNKLLKKKIENSEITEK